MSKADPTDKTILQMILEGRTQAEIAGELGVSKQAVKKRLRRMR